MPDRRITPITQEDIDASEGQPSDWTSVNSRPTYKRPTREEQNANFQQNKIKYGVNRAPRTYEGLPEDEE